MSVPLVVLAAGLSTRYGTLKQLDALGPSGEAIMDYNIYDAARAGFDSIVMIVRPEIEDQVRQHVEDIVGDALPVRYVAQTIDQLPKGFPAPPDRARPWGTGHAVLCAAEHLDGPFAICNADDLYGPGAFSILYEHLSSDPIPTDVALVGYTLEDTLSGSGGVARGICVLKKDGFMARVSEVQQIRRTEVWITGTTPGGEPIELSGDAVVSMNLWGFTQPVVAHMHRQFKRFMGMWGSDTDREFFLSTAINGQLEVGATNARVLHAEDHWFGVTHANDREGAQATLRQRVEVGAYPNRLADAFSDLPNPGITT